MGKLLSKGLGLTEFYKIEYIFKYSDFGLVLKYPDSNIVSN